MANRIFIVVSKDTKTVEVPSLVPLMRNPHNSLAQEGAVRVYWKLS
jgi:hypothetical protein